MVRALPTQRDTPGWILNHPLPYDSWDYGTIGCTGAEVPLGAAITILQHAVRIGRKMRLNKPVIAPRHDQPGILPMRARDQVFEQRRG